MTQDGGRRRGFSRRAVAAVVVCLIALVAALAYVGGWGARGGIGSIRSSSSSSSSMPRREEVVAANAVAGDTPLAQQYADAKSSADPRFGAKVTAAEYQTGYTEESKVDCGGCKWVLRDLETCCERDCNADPTTSSPYYCSGSDVAGDKMYDCHAAMCKETTMGKQCNAEALNAMRQGANTTQDARCRSYTKKVRQGAAVQTCMKTEKGKCTQWSV